MRGSKPRAKSRGSFSFSTKKKERDDHGKHFIIADQVLQKRQR